jgi:hypothetical protein
VYNLRYHIASLVAVFLALAVGLVLGTVVTESGLLKSQIQSTVASLNTTYSDLRTQIRSLQARDADLTSFASEAGPQISRDALTGRTVLIVADPDSAKTVTDASNAIRAAGGQVAVATFESPGLSRRHSSPQAGFACLGCLRARLSEAWLSRSPSMVRPIRARSRS